MSQLSRRFVVVSLGFSVFMCVLSVLMVFRYNRMEIRRMVLEAVGLSFEKNDRELKYIDAFGRNKVQLWELSNTSTNLTAIKKLIPYEYPVRANDFHLFEEAIGEKFDREISLYCSKQESVLVYLSKKHSKIYIIRHLLLSWGG